MKRRIFNIVAILAFLVPIIDLVYIMLSAYCSGDKHARASIMFIALYYLPFGIAELIMYNNAGHLLFRQNSIRQRKIQSTIALVVSGLFMITYFIYLHKTFMYIR